MIKVKVRVALAVGLLAVPGASSAGPIPLACISGPCIDFGGFGDGKGTISYAGGNAPLVGTDILVRKVWGFNTPENQTVLGLDVVSGALNFKTGEFLRFHPIGGYFFDGGGSFTITGGIPQLGIEEGATLAEGTFLNAFFSPGFAPVIFGPSGLDMKHPVLAAYFGFRPDTLFKFGGPTLTLPPPAGQGHGGPFSTKVMLLDVPNSPAPVPEPASLLLLSTGLAGMVYRRRSRAKASRG